jgi:hypothetical protein
VYRRHSQLRLSRPAQSRSRMVSRSTMLEPRGSM